MNNKKEHSDKKPGRQGVPEVIAEPNNIGAFTSCDFEGRNLTAYGGLLPVATMLEKLGFQQLIEETLTVKRVTRAMNMYQFALAMMMAVYVDFAIASSALCEAGADADRHPESIAAATAVYLLTFSSLAPFGYARQLLEVWRMRNECGRRHTFAAVTLDTDTRRRWKNPAKDSIAPSLPNPEQTRYREIDLINQRQISVPAGVLVSSTPMASIRHSTRCSSPKAATFSTASKTFCHDVSKASAVSFHERRQAQRAKNNMYARVKVCLPSAHGTSSPTTAWQ
jgi:hypothetical protein